MPTISNESDLNNFEDREKDLINNLNNDERKLHINNFLNQIKEKMHLMQKEIWVIDRFEENIAICENRQTKEIKKIAIDKLPENIQEGSVLNYKNGEYFLDFEEEKNIEKRIEEKMKNIWDD